MTPELQAKITLWRHKAAAGQLSPDEMREAVIALRADRIGASVANEKTRARKAPKAIPDANDLLAELGEAGEAGEGEPE